VTPALAAAPEEVRVTAISTRFEAPLERARAFGGVARFPLKKDRERR
jgi:hypothetical protein